MLTKDRILPEVGKTWWENNNVMMNFIHNHLSREGAAIFTLEIVRSQSTFHDGSATWLVTDPISMPDVA